MESKSDLIPAAPTYEDAGGDETVFKHLQTLQEAIEKYFSLYDAEDWKLEIDKSGVQMYSKKSGRSIDFTKRWTEVKVSKEDALSFFVDPEKFKYVYSKIGTLEVIKEIDDKTRLIRLEMKGNIIVSNRDLAVIRKVFELSDGSLFLIQTSIETDEIPKTKAVRAEMVLQGNLFKETSATSCSICTISLVDPKGSIPTSFVNKMKSKQHEMFVKIKGEIEK